MEEDANADGAAVPAAVMAAAAARPLISDGLFGGSGAPAGVANEGRRGGSGGFSSATFPKPENDSGLPPPKRHGSRAEVEKKGGGGREKKKRKKGDGEQAITKVGDDERMTK